MLTKFVAKRHIVTYLSAHFDTWYEWAVNTHGLEIKPEELRFVSGTVKTTKWACAAWSGSYKNKQGSVKVEVPNVTSLSITVQIEENQLPNTFWNAGPIIDPLPAQAAGRITGEQEGHQATTPLPDSVNQCIFFNYFTAKKRLFFTQYIKAAAGPHQLPPGGPDPGRGEVPVGETGSGDEGDIIEGPLAPPTYASFNPVAYLLDYILGHSEAEMAIASDRDLLAIFGADGIPEDIAAGLEERKPDIEVDESGVGTVSVDMASLDQQLALETALQMGVEGGTGDVGVHSTPEAQKAILDEADLDRAPFDPNHPLGEQDDQAEDEADPEAEERRKAQMAIWEPAANGHTGSVTALAVSPDSKWVASGSDDTMIILWDTEEQTVVRKWESHGDIVWHLAFSPDSASLASSGGEGRIMVWDVDGGELLGTLEGHTDSVHTVFWSPDGHKLASGSDDMTARIWDAQTYECLHLLEGHNAMVTFVLFSHNGQYLASGGADYNCRLWHVETGTLHKELTGHRGMVWTASFDLVDNRIATASDDGSVRIWKVDTGEELVTLHEHHGPVWVVAFSEDGKEILTGSSDSTLKICNSFSGKRVVIMEGHDSMVNAASLSPDGRYVASASSDNTLRLWRKKDGTNMKTFNEHNDKVTHAMFSPDGVTLSSGADDGTVRIRVLKDFVKLD
ncbi:WD40 repeat-like protein [Dichomitus squalens]|uniref:WD40 repeat-like protein n=1 Tax=Dichomitus squalens TaxID=114155 RepID=A0A4Q9MDX2_9APHY|nr:WD40 repeat-like protein [Dichomitus squalens]